MLYALCMNKFPLFTSSMLFFMVFKCGLSTHEGTWLIHVKNFLMFNIFHHLLNFTSITRLVNGFSSSNFPHLETCLLCFSSIIWTICVSLDVSSIYLSTKWTVLASLNFDFFYMHAILVHHLDML